MWSLLDAFRGRMGGWAVGGVALWQEDRQEREKNYIAHTPRGPLATRVQTNGSHPVHRPSDASFFFPTNTTTANTLSSAG